MCIDAAVLSSERDNPDWMDRCLFTGQPVVGRNRSGEHVLPRWMFKLYGIDRRRIRMADRQALVLGRHARAPANTEPNNLFGTLENKVRQGLATKDEYHLWAEKVHCGLFLAHFRLSLKKAHPQSPPPFDSRFIRGALERFRSHYAQWVSGTYSRAGRGSLVILPTSYSVPILHNIHGIYTQTASTTHDYIRMHGMLAISHNQKIIVATFGDDRASFETEDFVSKWTDKHFESVQDPVGIAAALCAAYFFGPMKDAKMDMYQEEPGYEDLERLADQMGLKFTMESERPVFEAV